MRLALLYFLQLIVLTAQIGIIGPDGQTRPPATPAPASKPEDLCTVEGQIVSAVNGSPVKKANILLMRAEAAGLTLPQTYTASSDASGKFAINGIEPGRYRMTVTRNGFVNATYGARSQFRAGTVLTLDRRQTLKNVDLRMTPHGIVTGRILDEDGEPVSYVNVGLMTFRYVQGKKQLMNTGGATTNDLGEYRLFGVGPGKYYLSATPRPAGMMGQAVERPANGQPEEDYVPTYYPGTVDSGGAVLVDVAAGATVSGIDLTLSKAHTVHVRGHVTNTVASRRPVQVMLTARSMGGYMGPMRSYMIDPAGNFDIRGVTPGAYLLHASLNDDGKFYTARIPLDVAGSNIENVNVTLGEGSDVSGILRVEGETTQSLSRIEVHLQPAETGIINFGGMPSAQLKDDRTFVLKNAGADLFRVAVNGLPDGMYVKAIQAGDIDVLAQGLDLSKGSAPRLEITIGRNAAALSGTVQNSNAGQPAPGATVVLVPQEKERKDQTTYYRLTTTDQRGSYTLSNLPPGEYKAFAWEDIEPGAYMDPDLVKPVEAKGESVSLRESDKKTLALTMIPAETTPPAPGPAR